MYSLLVTSVPSSSKTFRVTSEPKLNSCLAKNKEILQLEIIINMEWLRDGYNGMVHTFIGQFIETTCRNPFFNLLILADKLKGFPLSDIHISY